MNELKTQDWWLSLTEDCKAIITEAVFTSRWALVEGYWQLGKRIREDENWKKYSKGSYGSLSDLSKNIGVGERDIYRALQAYDKFPELDKIPEGKNITWNKLITKYLPEPKKEKPIPLPKGKYNIIYADPAWQYFEGGEKNQSKHYQTMDIEAIKNLKVSELADDNCILFLWATRAILPEAIEVLRCWGFEYSTMGFVWVKSKNNGTGFAFGLGARTRANAEYCLIGIKGKIETIDHSISEIIYTPLEEHSKKPDIVRDKIIGLVGDLPRVELFARQKVSGWDNWGNSL